MPDELELDFSDIEWADTSIWDGTWLDLDFSEFETTEEESTEKTEEEKTEEEKTPDEKVEEEKVEEKIEEKKVEENPDEIKKEEESPDETLSEIDKLLATLEDDSEKSEENIKKVDEKIEELPSWAEADAAASAVAQLKVDNSQLKTTVDQLNKLINKLNKEKWDIAMKNTELELYWNIEDPTMNYLVWNIDKAKWGDQKSKDRIVQILDDMRTELAWSTKEDEDLDSKTDIISKVSNLNNSSNPNAKAKGWIDDYQIEL